MGHGYVGACSFSVILAAFVSETSAVDRSYGCSPSVRGRGGVLPVSEVINVIVLCYNSFIYTGRQRSCNTNWC
ncbi:uncharacterized protein J3D65DRAFT_619738 [Phyllosticta citribraziliensis]|uniref:Secreted protein n=1 Tax=Phyllosticta citribraziliensis TaxID=989973 RepID=A0ABR1LX56_9PEZI